MFPVSVALRMCQTAPVAVTAVGFEPMPLRTGTWSQRLRPLCQTVRWHNAMARCKRDAVDHNVWFACGCPTWVYGGWCWHGCMIRVAVCRRWPLRSAALRVFLLCVVPCVAACPGLHLIRAVTADMCLCVLCSRCRLLSVCVRLRLPQ